MAWVFGYSFLDDEDSVWTHETHNHCHGDFGTGEHSTSHIESYWILFKSISKKLYPIFPNTGYIYVIREIEFRSKIMNKKDNEIIDLFFKMLKEVYDYCSFEFSDEEEIKNFNNYDY